MNKPSVTAKMHWRHEGWRRKRAVMEGFLQDPQQESSDRRERGERRDREKRLEREEREVKEKQKIVRECVMVDGHFLSLE